MKVKFLYLHSGGGTLSTHAKLVSAIITQMGALMHMPSSPWDLPELPKRILNAFKTTVAPFPKETLGISENAKTILQGRTVVIQKDDYLECFKFLRNGEDYAHFSQEYSVSLVLNDVKNVFKSKFIKPLGVYAFRSFPKQLEQHKDKLTGDSPAYVFHYKAEPGKYDYLQNLSKEKYIEARSICLTDAAKLVKLGIYPDAAPLFHNEGQNRRYVILVDLLVKSIRKSVGFTLFSPAGGAGRLDQPFTKIEFPNMTEIGLTDNRDAMTFHLKTDHQHSIRDMDQLGSSSAHFQQIEALARILLVDMLILEQRWRLDLDWQNTDQMKAFGDEIAQGLAYVFEGYTEKPRDKCLSFVRESGVDWSLAAKQIAFWVDTCPKGYPGWIAQNKVPGNLYEEDTKVFVDVIQAKNFNPNTGYSTNGNQDIGLYNGPLALTEFEKSMHLLVFALGLAEPLEKIKPPISYSRTDDHWYF